MATHQMFRGIRRRIRETVIATAIGAALGAACIVTVVGAAIGLMDHPSVRRDVPVKVQPVKEPPLNEPQAAASTKDTAQANEPAVAAAASPTASPIPYLAGSITMASLPAENATSTPAAPSNSATANCNE